MYGGANLWGETDKKKARKARNKAAGGSAANHLDWAVQGEVWGAAREGWELRVRRGEPVGRDGQEKGAQGGQLEVVPSPTSSTSASSLFLSSG